MGDIFKEIKQTTSPKEAADEFIEIPISDKTSVEKIILYHTEYIKNWGSKELIKGTKTDIYNIVLYNLEWTAKEYGFHYFSVDQGQIEGSSRITPVTDSNGTAIVCWLAKNVYYLCGNKYLINTK
jgi:hypothetical protein